MATLRTAEEIHAYFTRQAEEEIKAGLWRLTDEQREAIARLVGPDLRRMRAGSRTTDSPTDPRRAA